MTLRQSSRIAGSVQDLDRLDGLSDQPLKVLLVSDRTLYLLANFAANDTRIYSRYAKSYGDGDFYQAVEEDDTEADLVDEIANRFGLEVQPVSLYNPSLLPGLRFFLPLSGAEGTGTVPDISGYGRSFLWNGNPTFNHTGLIAYADLDGTGDYVSRADEAGLRILGTETYVASAVRGLTMGGWFWLDTVPGAAVNAGLMGKYLSTGNQRSYLLYANNSLAKSVISSNGSATTTVSSTVTLAAAGWYYLVARYRPSTELAIFVGAAGVVTKTANVTSIPASLFNSTAPFEIGRFDSAVMDGRTSRDWLCAAALSDAQIEALYQTERAILGI